jgi:tRNA dimethylallyltransferase
MEKILVICGTTSSGKSAYAFKLAKDYKKEVNILSVDSRQFYKDLAIVSGQDKSEDLPENVTLFGQGFMKATETPNIAEFKKYAEKIIKKSIEENKKLIIVGGSGLYLKAITQNLAETKVPPDEVFRKQAESLSVGKLQEILKKQNPERFNSLNNSDINNPRRLIRHIEISNHHPVVGATLAVALASPVIPDSDPESSSRHSRAGGNPSSNFYNWIGLRKNPETLLQSIRERVISRLKSGAVDEVRELQKNHPDTSLPIYSTLGVKEIIRFINSEITEEELINIWVTNDNNYAKRQIVWFKKQPNIVWYDISI